MNQAGQRSCLSYYS